MELVPLKTEKRDRTLNPYFKYNPNSWFGNDDKNTYYGYSNTLFKKETIETGAGSGGDFKQNTYYYMGADGVWKQLFSFGTGESYTLGHENDLIFIDRSFHQSGAANDIFGSDVGIYDPSSSKKQILSATNYISLSDIADFQNDLQQKDPITIFTQAGHLLVRVAGDYCFLLKIGKNKDITYGFAERDSFSLRMGENREGGCGDGFYELDEGAITNSDQSMRTYYLASAQRYQKLLEANRNKRWLSLLLERTIQYIFAGEVDVAWSTFEEDFKSLSESLPNPDYLNVDPDLIKRNIEDQLKDRAVLLSSLPGIPSNWLQYSNTEWNIGLRYPDGASIKEIRGMDSLDQINVSGNGYFITINTFSTDGVSSKDLDCSGRRLYSHLIEPSLTSEEINASVGCQSLK